MEIKIPCDLQKGECLPTPFIKATIGSEPQQHCQLFELIRFDAFMVKYQNDIGLKQMQNGHQSKNTIHHKKSELMTQILK